MHWSLFGLAGLALFLAHGLRLPRSGGRAAALSAFGLGLLVAIVGVRQIADWAGLGRTTEFDKFVRAAVEEVQQDPAPFIVFTGASYSRNAVDPERLTLALREAGYPHRAVTLSIEAASLMEREQHLHQFLKQSGRVPDIVFIEVAKAFDARVAFMFGNSKFNARAIEQYDLITALHTADGLVEGACLGLRGCVVDAGLVGLHAALNVFNVGLISQGESTDRVEAVPAFDPQTEAREAVDPAPLSVISDLPVGPVPQWAKQARARFAEGLVRAGVTQIAYYQPPVIPPDERAYVRALCADELKHSLCLHTDDAALLEALKGPLWLDHDHLLDEGAAIYNRWLADQIITSGLLEGGK